MIARGQHIQSINEMYKIQKSDGGIILMGDYDSPYSACCSKVGRGEAIGAVYQALTRPTDIDSKIKEKLRRD